MRRSDEILLPQGVHPANRQVTEIGRHRLLLEWIFGDFEEAEERVGEERAQGAPAWLQGVQGLWGPRLLLALGGLLVLAAALAYPVVQQRLEEERAARRRAIAEIVRLEGWAWMNSDWENLPKLLDPQARPEWLTWYRRFYEGLRYWAGDAARRPVAEVQEVELLRSDLARVRVHILQAEVPDGVTWQETRFYRWVDGRWRRTSPPLEQWGEPRVLETDRFRFEYQALDAAWVRGAGSGLDKAERHLRERLALPPAPADAPRLVVQIRPDNVGVDPDRFVGRRMVIPSPLLARTPVGYTPQETLLATVLPGLADRLLAQALGRAVPDQNWHFIQVGLKRWLAADAAALLIPEPVHVWPALERYVQANGFPPLQSLRLGHYPQWFWSSEWLPQAGESVVAYGLETYGVERLPALLDGLIRYRSWDALVPGVFGVSAEEFQAGWREWTLERLGRDE